MDAFSLSMRCHTFVRFAVLCDVLKLQIFFVVIRRNVGISRSITGRHIPEHRCKNRFGWLVVWFVGFMCVFWFVWFVSLAWLVWLVGWLVGWLVSLFVG
jgi:hypothetical protein